MQSLNVSWVFPIVLESIPELPGEQGTPTIIRTAKLNSPLAKLSPLLSRTEQDENTLISLVFDTTVSLIQK
jgi:hypothetical protein